jgi:hypothetical protein
MKLVNENIKVYKHSSSKGIFYTIGSFNNSYCISSYNNNMIGHRFTASAFKELYSGSLELSTYFLYLSTNNIIYIDFNRMLINLNTKEIFVTNNNMNYNIIKDLSKRCEKREQIILKNN